VSATVQTDQPDQTPQRDAQHPPNFGAGRLPCPSVTTLMLKPPAVTTSGAPRWKTSKFSDKSSVVGTVALWRAPRNVGQGTTDCQPRAASGA